MTRLIIIILALVICAMPSGAALNDDNLKLVDSIERAVANFKVTAAVRDAKLDSIKNLRRTLAYGEHRLALGEQLGRIYIKENIDSALTYFRLAQREAIELNDSSAIDRIGMQILAALPLDGVDIEAEKGFRRYDPSKMDERMKRIYWLCYAELYYNIQDHYPDNELKTRLLQRAADALDSVAACYTPNSPVGIYIRAQIHSLQGDRSMAAATFLEALPRLRNKPELYDMALSVIADYYEKRPEQRQQYISYMLQRTLSRLNSGYAAPKLMAETGELLNDEGLSDIGDELITTALNTSDMTSGPYRRFDRAYYAEYIFKKHREQKMTHWIVAGILVAVIAGTGLVALNNKRKAHLSAEKTKEAESSLSSVMTEHRKLSAGIMDLVFLCNEQLREYNIYVTRKLKTGQVKDLFDDISDNKYLKRMSEKFFDSFDETLLSYFPNFVDEVNSLLRPDKRLSLLPDRRMTPELRIAAFLRFGLSDSNKLSQLLNLSVNTIYTYRNRLKGRAIDRENFEKNLFFINREH